MSKSRFGATFDYLRWEQASKYAWHGFTPNGKYVAFVVRDSDSDTHFAYFWSLVGKKFYGHESSLDEAKSTAQATYRSRP